MAFADIQERLWIERKTEKKDRKKERGGNLISLHSKQDRLIELSASFKGRAFISLAQHWIIYFLDEKRNQQQPTTTTNYQVDFILKHFL